MPTNYTYSYTPGSTANLDRLRYLLGDNRGVPATYTQTTWLSTAQALHTDEELNDLLAATMTNSNVLSAARIAMQCRINRESQQAGVSGTTDTTDRAAAMVNALRQLEHLPYPLGDQLPDSTVRTNESIDDGALSDLGDET